MLKIDYSGALISILSVLLCLIFSGFVENSIGLVLILSVGIIHGANDLLIIKNVSGKTSKNNYIKSFILYIFVVFFLSIYYPTKADFTVLGIKYPQQKSFLGSPSSDFIGL